MASSDRDTTKGQPVSVRLTVSLNERLGALAAALDRPKSWGIEQAIEDYVALQDWQLAAIDEGIRAADEGRVVPQEDVEAWVRSWDDPAERPAPKRG
ncbi:ribbon-helix-helix protein, CopG family [Roseococcus sp. SYP-B2431]|uniref:CopG family ribbon-helix-helix protein n=1 Tax=Roseococcus sp. SYP-B2431 TaxID=2496640 RepID=UPI001039DC38|nr:CopG family ribbon-helix-helix protein [Roseococcus sp. SYP-B2431]TCI00697.1 ribbon-helix-helix protein, CopG family [Roseococcus sp. SYP-B2431]